MEGWIKLHRKMLVWEWFDDSEMIQLFIYLLISVNHKPKRWHGITVERGQIITSPIALAKELKSTPKRIRARIEKLIKCGVLGKQTTNKYTILTICNYDKYQDGEKVNDKEKANGGQTEDKRRANKGQQLKNDKKEKNIKEEYNAREGNFDSEFSNKIEVQETIKKIMDLFGYSEMRNFDKLSTCTQFVNVLNFNKSYDYFCSQLDSYIAFKSQSGERKHGFQSFIGSIENKFSDGGWNADNWTQKLSENRTLKTPELQTPKPSYLGKRAKA